MEIPSCSTVFHPEAAESSSTSTQVVIQQVDLIHIENAAMALANSPGSKALTPSDRAFSMSIVPQTRSSVATQGQIYHKALFLEPPVNLPCPARQSHRDLQEID